MHLVPWMLVFGPLPIVTTVFVFSTLCPMPDGFDLWRAPLRSWLPFRTFKPWPLRRGRNII